MTKVFVVLPLIVTFTYVLVAFIWVSWRVVRKLARAIVGVKQ